MNDDIFNLEVTCGQHVASPAVIDFVDQITHHEGLAPTPYTSQKFIPSRGPNQNRIRSMSSKHSP